MKIEINTYQNSDVIANSYVKTIRNFTTLSSPKRQIESNICKARRNSIRTSGIQLHTEIDLQPSMHLFDINEVLLNFEE